jgi:hypothetical protein
MSMKRLLMGLVWAPVLWWVIIRFANVIIGRITRFNAESPSISNQLSIQALNDFHQHSGPSVIFLGALIIAVIGIHRGWFPETIEQFKQFSRRLFMGIVWCFALVAGMTLLGAIVAGKQTPYIQISQYATVVWFGAFTIAVIGTLRGWLPGTQKQPVTFIYFSNRVISLVIALLQVVGAYVVGGGQAAIKVALLELLALVCIWWSDEAGAYLGPAGPIGGWRDIDQQSPGFAVAIAGWGLLLLPSLQWLIMTLSLG